MNQLTFSSILPFKIGKWWSSRLSLSAILKHDKASHYFDAPFDRKQWTGIGIWNNTFTLSQKPDIKIELSAFGQTKGIQGSYTIKPMGKTDAAIRYTFLNQAASIQLRLNDIIQFDESIYNHTQRSSNCRHERQTKPAQFDPVFQL